MRLQLVSSSADVRRRWLCLALATRLSTSYVATSLHYCSSNPNSWQTCFVRHRVLVFGRSTTSRFYATGGSQTNAEKKMTLDCRKMMDAAIQAVDPVTAVQQHFRHKHGSIFRIDTSSDNEESNGVSTREIDLQNYEKIVLVAFGKASTAMASAVLACLEKQQSQLKLQTSIQGVVITKDDHAQPHELEVFKRYGNSVKVYEAGHPVPDKRSVEASNALLDLVRKTASERTLVIACISGGGSSLFCAPHDNLLSLQDLQQTNAALLKSGWSITDVNVVRKRLEQGKGGRLAATAYPSTVFGLVLSDVLGDPLDLIASGPTVPDTSTWKDAWELVKTLPASNQLPENVMKLLKKGNEGKLSSEYDSPSPKHPVFSKIKDNLTPFATTIVVANNALAVRAAADTTLSLGYPQPFILTTQLQGEARHIAQVFVAMAQQLQQQRQSTPDRHMYPVGPLPAVLIFGGETTVTISKLNKDSNDSHHDSSNDEKLGGRNQELALAAAILLKKAGLRNIVVGCVGTDGTDGPTDAAGAIVDGGTIARLNGDANKALNEHNAYPYLKQKDSDGCSPLVMTGPTGTNVADVYIVLVSEN